MTRYVVDLHEGHVFKWSHSFEMMFIVLSEPERWRGFEMTFLVMQVDKGGSSIRWMTTYEGQDVVIL